MAKIVVAVGGNALGNTPEEQKEIVKVTAKNIVDILEKGHDLIVVHGNGPQVGMINLAFDTANKSDNSIPSVDFPECGSMSQGYIGYHLQNAITNEITKRNLNKNVASIITQTIVDKNDEAFKNPTKPIGSFYTEAEAKKLVKEKGWSVKEDAGRGFRRVIASPKPIDFVEKNIIKDMVSNGFAIIAAGGGGIPVYKDGNSYTGVAAVIDKDFAAAKAAELINADEFVILTAVEKVMINYNKPNQEALDCLTISEVNKHIADNQFAPGSMLPKIQAAVSFVESTGLSARIGSLENFGEVISGQSGTKITK